jgi:hypothetical protein
MPISSSPRSKFHGAGISGAPGQRAPEADTSSYNSERSCATDISHDGSPSEHRPRGCQISVLSRARKYIRRARAGGPLGAPILLRVYLPTAEATKNGGAGLDPRPQGRNTTRGRRQRRVSSSGNTESVRQRPGQQARNSSGAHSASGQSSSRMHTQWTALELE